MPLSRLDPSRIAALLLGVALLGCQAARSTRDDGAADDPNSPILTNFQGDDLYANLPDSRVPKIKDDDPSLQDVKADDHYEKVAMWAKERRDIITWCINEHVDVTNEYGQPDHMYRHVWPEDKERRPQTRFDQALAISFRVVERIPDNTPERGRLAQCLFNKGSACFWGIDACMNRIHVLMGEMGDDRKNPKFPKNVAEIEKLDKLADKLKKDMFIYHGLALTNFNRFMTETPMNKKILDYIWKIHFELGNFRESVRVMNQLLDEDILTDEKRTEYIGIRKEINDYLVEREINKDAPKPGLKRSKDDEQPQ